MKRRERVLAIAAVAILALAVDYFLGWLQNVLTPEGLKGRREAT